MYKGFYNLTSGMLTQQRNLNVVAHNLTNVSTAGFKQDRYTSSTFDDVMYARWGNKLKDGMQEIGRQSYIRASSNAYTDFTQGLPEPTGIPLDFAIEGEGFFAIRSPQGEILHTRAGSFSLDTEGYLWLSNFGRVLDRNQQEIQLSTDKVRGDNRGNLYDEESGDYLGNVGVFQIADLTTLEHNPQGYFTGGQGQAMAAPLVHWGYLERSNVDVVQQMTEMITTQRSLQSAAQVSKMYDNLMTKAVGDIGRV